MIVKLIQRPNDDLIEALYSSEAYYNVPCVFERDNMRAYALRAYWFIFDETPGSGMQFYVGRDVPLPLAITAAKAVIWQDYAHVHDVDPQNLSADDIEFIETYNIPSDIIQGKIRIVKEEYDPREGATEISVYFPPSWGRRW